MCRRLREYQDQESRAAAIAVGPLSAGGSVRALGDAVPAAAAAPAPAPPSRDRVAVLVDLTSSKTFKLANGESTIGRADRLTGFTPDIDLSSLDTQRTLSRRHAKIVSRDGDYYVREEIGTRNGTFVNGTRVQTGVDVRIASGDRVRFGMIDTVFEIR